MDKDKQPLVSSPYNVYNVFWLVLGWIVFYFSDIAKVTLYDEKINRKWLVIGVLAWIVNFSIAIFLIYYVTYWKSIASKDWEKQYPWSIPVATTGAVFGSICLMFAYWPVWSFLIIPILFFIFMSMFITLVMIPGALLPDKIH